MLIWLSDKRKRKKNMLMRKMEFWTVLKHRAGDDRELTDAE